MKVSIIDFGLCNLGSVRRAFEECGANPEVINEAHQLNNASKIVLPGVGNFHVAIKNLSEGGWVEPLRELTLKQNIPLLGICLGMQLLATSSEEHGHNQGLNLIPGHVRKIAPAQTELRVPHVGWNNLTIKRDSVLFKDTQASPDFYFVHSYHFVPQSASSVIATTEYGEPITAIVGENNVFGVQFHPEKSGPDGFNLIRNFLEL